MSVSALIDFIDIDADSRGKAGVDVALRRDAPNAYARRDRALIHDHVRRF